MAAVAASAASTCSLRGAVAPRSFKSPSHAGPVRFTHFLVHASTSTDGPSSTMVSSTPTAPITTMPTTPTTPTTPTEKVKASVGSPWPPPRKPVTTEEITSLEPEDIVADLKARWDAIENKTNVLIYGGGALVALWLCLTIVGAVNSVPLLPKILELVGLGYSGWFVYRYVLFKESRKQLVGEIDDLKAKITGATKDVVD